MSKAQTQPTDVLIISTRSLTDRDAAAVASAIEVRWRLGSISVDANLRETRLVLRNFEKKGDGQAAPRGSSPQFATSVRRLLLGNELSRAAVLARGVAQDRARLRRLIEAKRPAVIVIFDDRRVRPDLVALRLARSMSIPTVLVPFAVSTLESDLYLRRARAELEIGKKPWRRLKQRIASRMPHQVEAGPDGRSFTFFTPVETIVLDKLGLLPVHPWVWGGGGADRVCALGSQHRDYMVRGGVDPARIVVTGQPALDGLARTLQQRRQCRADLDARYGLQGQLPLVMCAVPQHGEHNLTDWDTHWRLTEVLFAALACSGANVLLSLHPKSKRTDYEQRASHHGLRILDEALAEVLPAGDLLVGTFSSTIGWAIGLGLPAVVIDNLRSGFRLYEDVAGVRIIDDHMAVEKLICEFVASESFRQEWRQAALHGRNQVGTIDGGNAARVADTVGLLVARAWEQGAPACGARSL